MKYLLMMFAFASTYSSAEMFKCFDGKRPKYTYQNMPCEDSGLKTAKKITDKDALIGSADLSGYVKEARAREAIERELERNQQERRSAEAARSTVVSSHQWDVDECPQLILRKRGILSQQRHRSTQSLQDEYNWVVKKMQKIDCIGS
ncbi:hypothetical protein [Janthinobacterium sp. B9-8]|uniref:hypothetical protein n=1 Tax=Janthinobacterium sp. B9-8 TaxID=1236179 RepID=UPI00061CDE0E|nr:hypothetical protein [Janthinobacterium sp. B9-8]AMC34247.1 hypothetical protein VN23_06370 [Janthinobacterium sp. B9-8]